MTAGHPHAVLASFPRSGRTWLAGMVSAAELRELRRQTTTPLRAFVNSDDAEVIAQWREAFGSLPQPPLRLATHTTYDAERHHGRVVMLVRAPADALWSYFHYRSSHRGDFSGTLDDFLADRSSGIPGVVRWYNSWAPVRPRATVIKYEDLRTEPGLHLRRALDGLDCATTADPDVIAERWAFQRRQKNEIESAAEGRSPNGLFIRSGAIGEGHANFSPAQRSHLADTLRAELEPSASEWMTSLGYLAD